MKLCVLGCVCEVDTQEMNADPEHLQVLRTKVKRAIQNANEGNLNLSLSAELIKGRGEDIETDLTTYCAERYGQSSRGQKNEGSHWSTPH